MSYYEKTKHRLKGVNPKLIKMIELVQAMNLPFDLSISEGLRTLETQKRYLREGKTKTINSRHLSGNAFDIYPIVDNKIPPSNHSSWFKLYQAFKQAAEQLGYENSDWTWGGSWKTFVDKPHYQWNTDEYCYSATGSKDKGVV